MCYVHAHVVHGCVTRLRSLCRLSAPSHSNVPAAMSSGSQTIRLYSWTCGTIRIYSKIVRKKTNTKITFVYNERAEHAICVSSFAHTVLISFALYIVCILRACAVSFGRWLAVWPVRVQFAAAVVDDDDDSGYVAVRKLTRISARSGPVCSHS